MSSTSWAAQPNISDDYFKSKRAAFLNALKCKTGLILAKAAAMRINATLEPAYLAPPSVHRLFARRQMSLNTRLVLMNFTPPDVELNLLGERSVLQGACPCPLLLRYCTLSREKRWAERESIRGRTWFKPKVVNMSFEIRPGAPVPIHR